MIRVAGNTLDLLGMFGVDVGLARSLDETTVELPVAAFAKSAIRAGDLELAARGINGAGDTRISADAVALYASFAASCTKLGIGEQTEQTRAALGELLARLDEAAIPAPGPVAGRLVALRRSLSALLENEKKPELVALARAVFAAVSESFGQVAARASEMVLRGVALEGRFPGSWELDLERASKTEAEIRQRAKERGGTPNNLTMVSDVRERIEALGGVAEQVDGKWRVTIKHAPISTADANQLSKLVEGISGEMARLGSIIPGEQPREPSDPRDRFWMLLSNELHDRIFSRFWFPAAYRAQDAFVDELLSAEARLAGRQHSAFMRLGTSLLTQAEQDASAPSRLWMRGRDRFWPGGETRAQLLEALADELLSKITIGDAEHHFDEALATFVRRAGLSEEQASSLVRLAEDLGRETIQVREPLEGLDFEAIATHFTEHKKDAGFYASTAGREALEALQEVARRVSTPPQL